MPSSFMSSFPSVSLAIEAMKAPVRANLALTESEEQALSAGLELLKSQQSLAQTAARRFWPAFMPLGSDALSSMMEWFMPLAAGPMALAACLLDSFKQMHQRREGELRFLEFLTEPPPEQGWTTAYDDSDVLLDLPSLRLIDISGVPAHRITNYTVVFAPRAGHHSNIAEQVALYMRDNGLSRMAIVEQKCCEDIPLMVNGRRHNESFAGQVEQYRQVLEHLARLTGEPAHAVAICQPGPLLAATIILYPHLAKTFGSAGSPMDTEAEEGMLSDFSRAMGENYIDFLLNLFGRKIDGDHPGAGRLSYDGSAHVLGFYMLGADKHCENMAKLLSDLRSGNEESARRQMEFYQWYNTVHHFPVEFIRDTFKEVFVKNSLARGELRIGERTVGIADFPGHIPVWALGGSEDNIAPPLQATSHLDRMTHVPAEDKLSMICEGGHMGLFRSRRILESHYTQIVDFIMARSDFAEIDRLSIN